MSRSAFVRALVSGLLTLAGGLRSSSALAGSAVFLVVVNRANPESSASATQLADIFLKRASRWQNGELVRAVDLRSDSAVRRVFSTQILKRSVAAVRHYWQQRIFSGRDVPPPELDSDEAVIRYVAAHRGAIGYVSSSANAAAVKVLAVT